MTAVTRTDHTGLDDLDPAAVPARDAMYFRAIVDARENLDIADQELRTRVREARNAGESWTVIGVALGVSRQAAQQRFSRG